MSVLIKGMEIPESCIECWFYVDKRCYLFSNGVPNRYNYDAFKKPKWCELIDVPTPHGRLIDADAIYPWYVKHFKEYKPNDIAWSMQDIACNLWNIPTVIEAEGK